MSGLIIAADLGALGDAARSLGGSLATTAPTTSMPSLGHPEGDSAVADFHEAMQRHSATLAAHVAAGSASLQGFLIAFRTAGE